MAKKTSIGDRLLQMWNLAPGEALSQRIAAGPEGFSSFAAHLARLWGLTSRTAPDQDRRLRFRDYDAMEGYSDISTALDIYAEEATQPSEEHEDSPYWIECKDKKAQTSVEEMFEKVALRDKLFGLARSVAKYGEYYTYLMTRGEKGKRGVTGLQFFHPSKVEEILDHDPGALRHPPGTLGQRGPAALRPLGVRQVPHPRERPAPTQRALHDRGREEDLARAVPHGDRPGDLSSPPGRGTLHLLHRRGLSRR
jgi:hypothetical protein